MALRSGHCCPRHLSDVSVSSKLAARSHRGESLPSRSWLRSIRACAATSSNAPDSSSEVYQGKGGCSWRIRGYNPATDGPLIVKLQTESFHEAGSGFIPFLDKLSYQTFQAEVVDALKQKTKYDASVFKMFVAEPEPKAEDGKPRIDGVVEATLCDDKEVLKAFGKRVTSDGRYILVTSMSVAAAERRKGLAMAMLRAAEDLAIAWNQRDLVLYVYEDNAAGVQLYKNYGMKVKSKDPRWKSILGGRIRLLMHKEVERSAKLEDQHLSTQITLSGSPEASITISRLHVKELGMLYDGGEERMRRAVYKLMQGSATLGFVGASCTEGMGGVTPWPTNLLDRLKLVFPQADVHMFNGARGGTSSSYMGLCVHEHVPQNADLIMVEFAVNDPSLLGTCGKLVQEQPCFEKLSMDNFRNYTPGLETRQDHFYLPDGVHLGHAGSKEPLSQSCFFMDKLNPLVLEKKGFEYINEAKQERARWGYVATTPGSEVKFSIDVFSVMNPAQLNRSSRDRDHTPAGGVQPGEVVVSSEDPTMQIQVMYLRSYEGMGRATIACSGGCGCNHNVINGNYHDHLSLILPHMVKITLISREKCVLTFRVDEGTDKGGHKVKIVGLVVTNVEMDAVFSNTAIDWVTEIKKEDRTTVVSHNKIDPTNLQQSG
eukprot:gene12779-16036_t